MYSSEVSAHSSLSLTVRVEEALPSNRGSRSPPRPDLSRGDVQGPRASSLLSHHSWLRHTSSGEPSPLHPSLGEVKR